MVSAEFKTAIPAINHLHTNALHRIATRIGSWCFYFVILCARIRVCSPVFNTCSPPPRHLPTHLLVHMQNHTSIHLPTHLRVLSNHQLLGHTPSYKYLPLYLPTCLGLQNSAAHGLPLSGLFTLVHILSHLAEPERDHYVTRPVHMIHTRARETLTHSHAQRWIRTQDRRELHRISAEQPAERG